MSRCSTEVSLLRPGVIWCRHAERVGYTTYGQCRIRCGRVASRRGHLHRYSVSIAHCPGIACIRPSIYRVCATCDGNGHRCGDPRDRYGIRGDYCVKGNTYLIRKSELIRNRVPSVCRHTEGVRHPTYGQRRVCGRRVASRRGQLNRYSVPIVYCSSIACIRTTIDRVSAACDGNGRRGIYA